VGRRPGIQKQAGEPIFGPPATSPKEAFIRFGNALHWEAHFPVEDLREDIAGAVGRLPDAVLNAALKRLPRAEHRLVAEFITELMSGTYSFAEAQAIWKESENDTMYLAWDNPDALLRFLTLVRDRIDPHVWPASRPRFRAG
jgi:hypothetical protein